MTLDTTVIENKMSVYSMHTNLDASKFGLNDYVAHLLGALNTKIVDENIITFRNILLYSNS